ncbi:UDP binding domain-containing protein [Roseicyclus sp. F158]|uniref:UDP binding domain-containing protein n=1 Tax=Tropicimonas omnivorans TaxID=3075590 RepID=A0ABU3DLG3_9RHOB|nr:UDP binding domain-containing protein [Roseicyclus sp. F158]MDT0684542.1 UDP binding domain-containing protein [Roseicyclus sp. F158]
MEDPYAACTGADALVILTEWNQFRALDLARMAASMSCSALVDLRNIYDRKTALQAGFETYVGVER